MTGGKSCYKCGYALAGLPLTGLCPECGTPVAESMRGVLLQFASPEYIRTVREGYAWVLNGILASIVIGVLVAGVGVAAAIARTTWLTGVGFTLASNGVTTLVGIAILYGYIKLTEPDPQFTGTEKPDSARNVVRIAAGAQVAISLAALMIVVINGGTPVSSFLSLLGILNILLTIAAMAAWAVQFFAMMRYVRWMARRVPDQYVVQRTEKYMWLLPVLTTVGVVLIGLGPLIALIMYWNLLDRMRKHLKSIEATGAPAALPKMAE